MLIKKETVFTGKNWNRGALWCQPANELFHRSICSASSVRCALLMTVRSQSSFWSGVRPWGNPVIHYPECSAAWTWLHASDPSSISLILTQRRPSPLIPSTAACLYKVSWECVWDVLLQRPTCGEIKPQAADGAPQAQRLLTATQQGPAAPQLCAGVWCLVSVVWV